VRGEDDIRERAQFAFLGEGLVLEDIEPGGGDLAGLQRGDEGRGRS
jgi:hypothetical protein